MSRSEVVSQDKVNFFAWLDKLKELGEKIDSASLNKHFRPLVLAWSPDKLKAPKNTQYREEHPELSELFSGFLRDDEGAVSRLAQILRTNELNTLLREYAKPKRSPARHRSDPAGSASTTRRGAYRRATPDEAKTASGAGRQTRQGRRQSAPPTAREALHQKIIAGIFQRDERVSRLVTMVTDPYARSCYQRAMRIVQATRLDWTKAPLHYGVEPLKQYRPAVFKLLQKFLSDELNVSQMRQGHRSFHDLLDEHKLIWRTVNGGHLHLNKCQLSDETRVSAYFLKVTRGSIQNSLLSVRMPSIGAPRVVALQIKHAAVKDSVVAIDAPRGVSGFSIRHCGFENVQWQGSVVHVGSRPSDRDAALGFYHCDFRGGVLAEGSKWDALRFEQVKFADFAIKGKLTDGYFKGVELERVKISGEVSACQFRKTNFSDCQIPQGFLVENSFRAVQFKQCDMTQAFQAPVLLANPIKLTRQLDGCYVTSKMALFNMVISDVGLAGIDWDHATMRDFDKNKWQAFETYYCASATLEDKQKICDALISALQPQVDLAAMAEVLSAQRGACCGIFSRKTVVSRFGENLLTACRHADYRQERTANATH